MPMAAPRPCTWPGCGKFSASPGSRCERHRKVASKEYEARRPSAHDRGYTSVWRKAREGFLRNHPTCKLCDLTGRATPSTIVDHVIPHKGDKVRFWDSSNWQALCKPCHDRKTATEDGGWGRGTPT
jgi:5-methylcytosine-specific restriction enzyme A